MGMFDYLRCEFPLPDGRDGSSIEFVTKDTNAQWSETYVITKDGRLLHKKLRYEIVPEEKRPYYGKPEWFDKNGNPGLMSMIGMMETFPDGEEFVAFHGCLRFYGRLEDGSYVDYEALFDRGKLIRIDVAET
jgi:hypothetical protein